MIYKQYLNHPILFYIQSIHGIGLSVEGIMIELHS